MKVQPVKSRLLPLLRRQRAARLWTGLALCWVIGCLVALAFMVVAAVSGWLPSAAFPCLLALAVLVALGWWVRHLRTDPDWLGCVRTIEARRPELNGRLVTAIEQQPDKLGQYTYLQHRLFEEVLAHDRVFQWDRFFSASRLGFVKLVHALAFAAFLVACLRGVTLQSDRPTAASGSREIVVTPGDASVERGSRLVVMARFNAAAPTEADLILQLTGRPSQRLPLVRSLEDPVFGGSIPDIREDLQYLVEYDGNRTRSFEVRVFEYPRLDRADVELTFPEYTGLARKRIEDTRRLTAVRGTRVDLSLLLNKPVAEAQLLPRTEAGSPVAFVVDPERAEARLTGFELLQTERYTLRLVDADGRTNKPTEPFFFHVLSNQAPEMRIAAPRGDIRPSALEEIRFDGTVFDDFGVLAYGLAYVVGGQEIRTVELGSGVPGNEKRSFEHHLALEELDLQTGDLVSWFVWCEDTGPDGRIRRTLSDLYFAEIRPFEEIFRQGQSQFGQMNAGQQSAAGGEGGRAGRLLELQQQIIHATWTLQRRQGTSASRSAPAPQTSIPTSGARSHSVALPWGEGAQFVHRRLGEGQRAFEDTLAVHADIPLNEFLREMLHASSIPQADRAQLFGQRRGTREEGPSRQPRAIPASAGPMDSGEDLRVVMDAQEEALLQALEARQQQQDPRQIALWNEAIEQMESALRQLAQVTNNPVALQEALAAQQAAYQELLRLQENEYSVSQNRNQNPSGNQGGRQQQMQRQLDQLDLVPEESRYETERLAQAPQSAEQREQLQAMSRLAELARRQQDINERLQELQVALQAAESDEERQELQRELKRLQQEQQTMLSDLDELRQQLDSQENRSRFAEQRQQLEETRESLQRAAEAAAEGAVSQALAAGTRAQREMQQMREDLRNQSASAFAEDMRRMRADARELARQQAQLQDQLEALNESAARSLGDSEATSEVRDRLRQQRERLTNLVAQASQVSELAEQAEPLLAGRLYDTLREFDQDDLGAVKEVQEDLLANGLFPLYEQLKSVAEASEAKTLDMISTVLDEGYVELADEVGRRALEDTESLARGITQAAEMVLGDDAEALRWAADQLNELTEQLEQEAAQATGPGTNAPTLAAADREGSEPSTAPQSPSATGGSGAGERPSEAEATAPGSDPARANEQEPTASAEDAGGAPPSDQAEGSQDGRRLADQQGPAGEGTRQTTGSTPSALGGFDLEQFMEGGSTEGGLRTGPITGNDFGPWSDRLREIEEIVENPGWRDEVTRARERARQLRRDYTRNGRKPDWAQVRLKIVRPLVEVQQAIGEELARRESRDTLVPIDRDPVPDRYSELVRRYYEELGKDPD